MVRNAGTCLYKEARLNIEPAFPGSTIAFTLPATNSIGFGTRAKRTVYDETDVGKDEEAFAKRHLASDGSMYFGRRDTYPRSFLWRLLDDRKTLEVQAVDLQNDDRNEREANLTLLFQFPSPIRPFCLAFADEDRQNTLTIFAITANDGLYTLSIPCSFFSTETASEVDIDQWCRRPASSLLVGNAPCRLVAVDSNQLLVSLDNGSILRLRRGNKDDLTWEEATFQQTNWSLTLRGVLSWKGQQTVRYGNADFPASTAANMALSPDGQHLIAVGLDHTLRMFNVQSGKLMRQHDLLNMDDDAQDRTPSQLLGPSHSSLLQVFKVPGSGDGAYCLVVYSPIGHEFKFYVVRSADDLGLGAFANLQPEFAFVPPVDDLMNATVWTMEEFHVVPSTYGWNDTTLWLRARSGPSSRVYSITFDPSDDNIASLEHVWRHNWTTVDSGPLTVEGLRKHPRNPGTQKWDSSDLYESDVSEQWLDFLLVPARFTVATLETALLTLRKGLERNRSVARPKGTLKDRLSATIVEGVTRRSRTDETQAYEQLVAEQWEAYYGLVKDLHKRRGESLYLAYDPESDLPWLVRSDSISAVRKCSEAELILSNSAVLMSRYEPSAPLRHALRKPDIKTSEAARLLNAAASFRRRLSPSFQRNLKRSLHVDLLQSRSMTIEERMEQMDIECDLENVATEDDIGSLIEDLGQEFRHLTTEIFQNAIRTLKFELDVGKPKSVQTARYGLKALLETSSENLDFTYERLLDLLVLVLLINWEEELSDECDAPAIFFDLSNEFKDWMVLDWITTNVWSHQTPTGTASMRWMKDFAKTSKTSSQFPITQTILEGMFGHTAGSVYVPGNLKSGFLTYWSQGWLSSIFSPPDQSDWDYNMAVEDMMAKLLVQNEYNLAKEFSTFLPESSWSSYLKGRMFIALGDNHLASLAFQKPAFNLSLGAQFDLGTNDTAHLVDVLEQDNFSDGLPNYYNHVLGLFEKVKAYSYVSDFARLALNSMMGPQDPALRSDLLQRLFSASIQTSRLEEAYTALIRQADPVLKEASLKTLVEHMVKQGQTVALFKFPLMGLVEEMDSVLSELCHKTLNMGSGPAYHQMLYSFRISRGNFRGAATILYERLQRLKSTSSQVHDPADESLIQCYLMMINALSLVSPEDAYILADQRIDDGLPQFLQGPIGTAKKLLKRHIVTLDTLRKEYQEELDRVANIESGNFAFMDPTDEMDIL